MGYPYYIFDDAGTDLHISHLSIFSDHIKFILRRNIFSPLPPNISIHNKGLAFLIKHLSEIHADQFLSRIAEHLNKPLINKLKPIIICHDQNAIQRPLHHRPVSLFGLLHLFK